MDVKNKCELSIIIPIYNGSRFLRETLDSALNQTYKEYELILVDDGSTDETTQICAEYAAKDSRIKVRHQKNGGMSNARDNGYKMAQEGTYIAFLDADDIFHPDMFKDMMKYGTSDIVCVCFENVLSSKILEHSFHIKKDKVEHMSGKTMLHRLFERENNNGEISRLWGMLIKRDFYEKMLGTIREAESILPQNYLNDIYCVPRFLFNADTVTLLNNVYIFHRISKYTDSRLLKPNALHYELALANKMNMEYYTKKRCKFAYEESLIGFYLVILKIWYQTVTQEDNETTRKQYMNLTQKYYDEYFDALKKLKCKSISRRIVKGTIILFKFNKTIWKLMIGDVRYKIMYRFQQ